jgi:hypothetical protein
MRLVAGYTDGKGFPDINKEDGMLITNVHKTYAAPTIVRAIHGLSGK